LIAFAGVVVDALAGLPKTRICLADARTGDTRLVTFGPNTDRLPKFSPDGRKIAFLSDRRRAGDFQLYLLDLGDGQARAAVTHLGWVEYFLWSPDGADVAGGQGAVQSAHQDKSLVDWLPLVETSGETYRWRSVCVFDLATGRIRQIPVASVNIWECAWAGERTIVAVTSPDPGEGAWYSATLDLIDIESGSTRTLFKPKKQLGLPSANPTGSRLACVESTCSDRGIIAGDIRLIDAATGRGEYIDTKAMNVSFCQWLNDDALLIAGHRDFETIVSLYNCERGGLQEMWSSETVTTAGRYISVAAFGENGDFALITENFQKAPCLDLVRGGRARTLKEFDLSEGMYGALVGSTKQLRWRTGEGPEIQGHLLRPSGNGPFPLITNIHGGPVWQWRPNWLGRSGLLTLLLLQNGYAVFLPNPRGSGGRGQDYIDAVYGDMGGCDAQDILAGIDRLIEDGVADPERLGVTGGSYGGFMSSWLVTQTRRFGAAVPFAPHTNQVTQRLLSNIPQFTDLILRDLFDNLHGRYFERSPVMRVRNVRTPTLNICGALDRCTPPEEARQFHNALVECGVESALVTYPLEGHGVRAWPASIDFAARALSWFEKHLAKTER
jgi:dipeptidyl aminopeptidase/acylaminoacyl peptidase